MGSTGSSGAAGARARADVLTLALIVAELAVRVDNRIHVPASMIHKSIVIIFGGLPRVHQSLAGVVARAIQPRALIARVELTQDPYHMEAPVEAEPQGDGPPDAGERNEVSRSPPPPEAKHCRQVLTHDNDMLSLPRRQTA
eukprot:7713222-Pyramimonas_sp.AAC.1